MRRQAQAFAHAAPLALERLRAGGVCRTAAELYGDERSGLARKVDGAVGAGADLAQELAGWIVAVHGEDGSSRARSASARSASKRGFTRRRIW